MNRGTRDRFIAKSDKFIKNKGMRVHLKNVQLLPLFEIVYRIVVFCRMKIISCRKYYIVKYKWVIRSELPREAMKYSLYVDT